MSRELLPCPFCGGDADIKFEWSANVVSVGCPLCDIRTAYHVADNIGIEEAVCKWNARANIVQVEQERAAVPKSRKWNCFTCGACGGILPGKDARINGKWGRIPKYQYCGNCGTRIDMRGFGNV